MRNLIKTKCFTKKKRKAKTYCKIINYWKTTLSKLKTKYLDLILLLVWSCSRVQFMKNTCVTSRRETRKIRVNFPRLLGRQFVELRNRPPIHCHDPQLIWSSNSGLQRVKGDIYHMEMDFRKVPKKCRLSTTEN